MGSSQKILDAIGLTDNHVQPFDLAQNRSVLDDILISRQQDLEMTRPQFSL